MLNGIDVSNLQGASFNWEPYKGKIEFAFIKVSEGLNFADADAARNAQQARALGIARGFYHFLHPWESGAQQWAYFAGLARKAGLAPGDLVMLDTETNSDGRGGSLAPAQVSACAGAFATAGRDDVKAWPVSYTDQSMAENGSCASLGLTPAFIANPSHVTLPSPIGPWHLVSFIQTGQRGVDTDVFNGDLAELARLAIPHPVPRPAPKVSQAQALAAVKAAEQDIAGLVASVAVLSEYASQG